MIAIKIGSVNPSARGNQILYQLDPPLDGYQYVVALAAIVPYDGPETYLFPADANGEIIDWGELEGSYKGGLDHDAAIEGAGYEVQS